MKPPSMTTKDETMALTLSRKQRLRTLEDSICKLASSIQKNGLTIGRDLCEIRDDELWKDECDSWNQYLKERAGELVGRSFAQAARLIQAAEIQKCLPQVSTSRLELPASALVEIGRLAPHSGKEGAEKDYSKLRKKDVARVLQTAATFSGDKTPSVRDIRKAVDIDLGIDRSAQAKATKAKNNNGIDLDDYLRRCIGNIEGYTTVLSRVPADAWTLLEESNPKLAKRLAAACDELAELMRS